MYASIALLAGFLLVYSVIAGRLERTWISGAIVFTGFGVLIGPLGLGLFTASIRAETLRTLAELTLALVLFTDAAGTDLKLLRRVRALPIRLLLIGLPLTIGLGFVTGTWIFGELHWVEVALLATMLAPTDAALGKSVVSNPDVPASIREGLNVESGLNDGICVPVLLLFLALAGESAHEGRGAGLVLTLFAEEIGIGAAVGVGVTLAGSTLARACLSRGWVKGAWDQIPVVSMAFLCFALAQWIGGSGFIAAFIGGLVFGAVTRTHRERVLHAAEGTGNALSVITWVIFGAAVVGRSGEGFDARALVYALLSLTVIRMLPVLLCLAGYGATLGEKVFMAWFGPRGLASIVFAVMVFNADLENGGLLVSVVEYAVVLSVVLHGVTAAPWAGWLGRRRSVERASG